MAVISYGLDKEVFNKLDAEKQHFKVWKAKASDISDYVATWGVVRFWALSRSKKGKNGRDESDGKSYYTWRVAREVLCLVINPSWGIKSDLNTNDFQNKFYELDVKQQILIAELLIEIADTIQFWTMRFDETLDV